MSTINEIESAIENLPPDKAEAVFLWLQARREKNGTGAVKQGGFPLFGLLKDKITYREGWDEPLEDFKPYME
jgi:hypothetical protein